MTGRRSAAEIRAGLDHPVIDADGHWVEFAPLVLDELERIGGSIAAEGFDRTATRVTEALEMTIEERNHRRVAEQCWWGYPTVNARDRATSLMPALLSERLGEFGFDFAVMFPTHGLGSVRLVDAEMRQATCRAFNTFMAEYFGDYSDRLTPAAVIPMHTPSEAIAELEHARLELGLKAVVMSSLMPRPIAAYLDEPGRGARTMATWPDTLGIDSAHDYDEVWAACAELGVSPTFHMGSRGYGFRVSPTNFTYNHIGHFAQASEAVCKSLFLAGVTARFPQVKFGFLEGGVAWAANLYADLIGHWEKRNAEAMEATNPANIDWPAMTELADRYGHPKVAAAIRERRGLDYSEGSASNGHLVELDDFAACNISEASDIRDLFVESFYFGCEADDRLNPLAYQSDAHPFGARFKTLFGSDIGHFDVVDMAEVLGEAHELVDEQLVTADDFRDFVYTNPVRFWGEANPAFFEGTAVEDAAYALLGSAAPA
ncbi:MAG: amidohydrolase family protein [Acidimicrobiia bacterium]|nr:amidohydrolase family protein [Acidimicrobiia bacterium]